MNFKCRPFEQFELWIRDALRGRQGRVSEKRCKISTKEDNFRIQTEDRMEGMGRRNEVRIRHFIRTCEQTEVALEGR
jgi:hypothetical protein